MGQYHKFMNFDKKEILEPPGLLKLMEWSYQKNEYMLQVENLIKTSWKGDRVLVIGDYADDFYDESYSSKLLKIIRDENKDYNINNIYDYPYKIIKNSSFYSNRLPSRYIYNDALKEYIDLKKQPIQWVCYDENLNLIDGSKIHPLSLVLSCCNGAGGGDYYAENIDDVGCWASTSNSLRLSDELLDIDYKEANLIFNEMNEKEDNIEIIIDYITENFKNDNIKKVENLKFSPSFFLDENEKSIIVERSMQNIKNKELGKEIKNDSKKEALEKAFQDIRDIILDNDSNEEIEI